MYRIGNRAVTTGGAGGAIAPPIFLDGPKRRRKYEFLNDFLGDLHPLFFGPCYVPDSILRHLLPCIVKTFNQKLLEGMAKTFNCNDLNTKANFIELRNS